jgi:hypothetical protein
MIPEFFQKFLMCGPLFRGRFHHDQIRPISREAANALPFITALLHALFFLEQD